MRWCQRCVLPDTRPNLRIDADGVCNACRTHESKAHIDWDQRRASLERIADSVRGGSQGYDCIVPVSGGKDSTWQVVRCLELGLRVLAVTWRPPGRTAIGEANLRNLVSLGVDHIDYSINPDIEARFACHTFSTIGSTAVPMHLALFGIPLTLAVRLRVPLVIWGENSAFEYGSTHEADTGVLLDGAWLRRYGVTNTTGVDDWISEDLPQRDLVAYRIPSDQELAEAGVRAVFLGWYLRWDPEDTRRVAEAHGFQAADKARTGYYDYADIDDEFISLHHWMKWYKFGFTRLFDNLSLEIRNNRMTRVEALDIIRRTEITPPQDDIEAFCRFVGQSDDWFHETAETFRNPKIWEHNRQGQWYIPEFLLDDWTWT